MASWLTNSAKAILGMDTDKSKAAKKVVDSPPTEEVASNVATLQNSSEPLPQELNIMAKPSSYFSVQNHTFTVALRKDKKGEVATITEPALFFEKELMEIEFKPMPTVPVKTKNIREKNLIEIAKVLEGGYAEETTAVVLKEKGYKELIQVLKENKVLVLDFCQFVKDELDKIPTVRKQRVSKGKGSRSNELVPLLVGLVPNLPAADLPQALKEKLGNEELVKGAVEHLLAMEHKNGRDDDGYIKLRKSGKRVKK